jgi:hypothetical protein
MRKTDGSKEDASHELQIKHFKHEGIDQIGLLMLCPNPACRLVRNPTASQKRLAK